MRSPARPSFGSATGWTTTSASARRATCARRPSGCFRACARPTGRTPGASPWRLCQRPASARRSTTGCAARLGSWGSGRYMEPMTAPVSPDVIARLKSVLGEGGWSQDPTRLAPKLVEERGRWKGTTPLLVLPRTVEAVAAVVGVCFETGTPIVPQGGNTGLVAGQTPQGEILLSLERMKAVREVTPLDDALIAEAGVTLAAVHEAAAAADRLFP